MALYSGAFLVGGLVGAALAGTVGTVYGTTVAAWIGAAAGWWQLHVARRDSCRGPADDQLSASRQAVGHRRAKPNPDQS